MIYILLVVLIIQLIYCYYVFDRNLFSPSAIICEVFIMSTLACIANIDNWGVDLKPATLSAIIGGNTIFILTSTLLHFIYKKKKKEKENEVSGTKELEYINVHKSKIAIILVSYLVFSVLFVIMSIFVIGQMDSTGDISSTMSLYRSEIVDGASTLPSWLTKIGVVFNLGTFVLIYVFINNFIVDRKRKENYLLLFCVILYLGTSILLAQRTTIILMFIYILFVGYSLLRRKQGALLRKNNIKYIRRGIFAVVVFLLLFGLTRGIFGRQDQRTLMDSVTYYMGNSIESLDLYIESPIKTNQFGEELFRQPRIFLSRFGLVPDTTMENVNLEFRKDGKGNSAGNVYTAYRYYLHDFGFASIVPFQILLALFYGVWYEKISSRKLKRGIDFSFVVYAWFVLSLFYFSLANTFFTNLAYFVFTHWYVFVFWWLFVNAKYIRQHDVPKIKNAERR